MRGIVYQDLIAILTVAVQVHGREMAELNDRLARVEANDSVALERRLAALESASANAKTLEQRVAALERENRQLRALLGTSIERRLAALEAKFAPG